MHAIAHGGLYGHRKRVCTECWLWEETPLPHWGLKPVSVLRLAFQSDALPPELSLPTHASLHRDVADTDCGAQNGSTHGHVSGTLRCHFFTDRMRNPVKNAVCMIFSYSIPISGACDASLVWFPFKQLKLK